LVMNQNIFCAAMTLLLILAFGLSTPSRYET